MSNYKLTPELEDAIRSVESEGHDYWSGTEGHKWLMDDSIVPTASQVLDFARRNEQKLYQWICNEDLLDDAGALYRACGDELYSDL